MLKDNWEKKHGINLPVHSTFPKVIQGTSTTHVGALNATGSTNGCPIPQKSNLQDGRLQLPVNPPTFIQTVNSRHQFDNEFHQQNHLSGTRPPFPANPYGNGIEETCKPRDNVCSQTEARAEQALVDSHMQELIKFLSANYGPMKTPLEVGTPEYLRLVEILKQSYVQPNGGTNNIPNVEIASSIEDRSSISRDNQEKISSEKLSSEKAATEKLWDGSIQLSSSVTLSAVAFFKSGEKLLGNKWPEFIEVKGKVRLEAFEKYVQDLPRSRNRGLMVTSICWNEESSNIGLNGMKEVAKGYNKSSRVGFAQLCAGIDLYICPRSDSIITILAKYGFFKGMSVIDDKADSMIGCVVWRKNRPLNPVGNTSDGKSSPSLSDPQNSPPGFSFKQGVEKNLSPAKPPPESSQHNEPLTLPLTTTSVEVEHNGGGSSSSSSPLQNCVSCDPCNLVRKRPFEDDDLPEFDFGVACAKSAVVIKPLNPPIPENSQKMLDNHNTCVTQPPSIVNAVEGNKNNSSLKQSTKKSKLFDDDDMPEWQPPELNNQQPPQITTLNLQTLPSHPPLPPPPPPPPRPPIPPPPRADTRSSFSYHPIQPALTSQPPLLMRPPPPPPTPPPQRQRLPPPLPTPPPQRQRLPPPPLPTPPQRQRLPPPLLPTPPPQRQWLPPPPPSGSSCWLNSNGRWAQP